MCFEKGVEMKVVKNIFIKKVFEVVFGEKNYEEFYQVFKGYIVILFIEIVNVFVKLIKEFCKDGEKFVFKVVYIEFDVYIGDDQFEVLVNFKLKEDLLVEVILLLQFFVKNVIGFFKFGGQIIVGLFKVLEECVV